MSERPEEGSLWLRKTAHYASRGRIAQVLKVYVACGGWSRGEPCVKWQYTTHIYCAAIKRGERPQPNVYHLDSFLEAFEPMYGETQ